MSAASILGLDFDDGLRSSSQPGVTDRIRFWSSSALKLLCLLICLAVTLPVQGASIQSDALTPRTQHEHGHSKYAEAPEQDTVDTTSQIRADGAVRNQTRRILQKTYEQLLAAQNANGNLAVLQRVSLSGSLSRLRTKLIAAIRHERALDKVLKHKHPDLIQARAELGAINAQFVSRLRPLVRRAKADWLAAEAAVVTKSQRPSIEVARPLLGPTNDSDSLVSSEQKAVESQSAKSVAETGSEPDLQPPQPSTPLQKQNLDPISMSQPASPSHPILILSLGFLAGLCLGILLARVKDTWERHVTSSEQLALVSGHPVLPAIPRHDAVGLPAAWYHSKNKHIDAGPYSDLLSALAGAFDDDGTNYRQAISRLLTRIKSHRRPGRPHSILFASPRTGVGNSALTLSLSYAAALEGARVLVVDATSNSLGIAQALNASLKSDGVIALDNKEQLSQIIFVDGSSGLSILPISFLGLDALTDAQRRRLVAGLNNVSQNYDLIFVDCGGLLGGEWSSFLLDYADQIVFVARAGVTTVADVRQTMALIEPSRSRISGAVLTYSSEVDC
jgi:Mrp family chromosome partitioning ATPase